MYPNESAPAIPKDAPKAVSPVVAVPVAPQSIALPDLPVENLPMDRQLWDHVLELRGGTESEPTKLRFGAASATAEPALRFTPKQTAPPEKTAPPASSADNADAATHSTLNQLRDLLPTNEANPNSKDSAVILPPLENAPKPAFAEIRPAYRTAEVSQAKTEKGMTFQNRIDAEIKRSPTATETYVVQQGDTYMTISDKFYGTSLLYTALAAHNQKSGIGWRPAEGVVIEIPTAEFLRTQYSGIATRHERRLTPQQSGIRYVVQEGDTIFRLATDKLQDSTRWREIYAMNMDRIQDVRDLKPGMEILLPVRRL
jgi:nucleoid-associated protein YgaU